MRYRLGRLLAIGSIFALALVACDDDEGGSGPTGPSAPVLDDLSSFTGAWVIHSTGSPTYFCGTGECRDQLESVLDTYFSIPAIDSVCVGVDSLRHLVLIEPFVSQGAATGTVLDETASIECEHLIVQGEDTLIATISADLFVNLSDDTLFGDYTVAVEAPEGGDCGSCRALLGIAAVRRVTGTCGP